eukprot:CAMPEP_0117424376 /NCGR_PEP_ID=MMETSP0758-20121206/4805_1 /TAXON_ID=63605 /ORGANISM="Percolomonas cosmopolitus, Strain AE-1 (ATCC 50343)" /LENGTH=398 /DNA_ID=CAMNT_0005208113 /DNA_START=216 /DNA_END=1409 /DNA_ORIENTATION=-
MPSSQYQQQQQHPEEVEVEDKDVIEIGSKYEPIFIEEDIIEEDELMMMETEEEEIVEEQTYQHVNEPSMDSYKTHIVKEDIKEIYPKQEDQCIFKDNRLTMTTFSIDMTQHADGYLRLHVFDVSSFLYSPKLVHLAASEDDHDDPPCVLKSDYVCWLYHEPLFRVDTFLMFMTFLQRFLNVSDIQCVLSSLCLNLSIAFTSEDDVQKVASFLQQTFSFSLGVIVDIPEDTSSPHLTPMDFLVHSLSTKRFVLSSSIDYLGEVSPTSGLPDGFGELFRIDASSPLVTRSRYYQGHFRSGVLHGHGTFDGSSFQYRGLFSDGDFDEFGFLTCFGVSDARSGFSDLQTLYEGGFSRGQRHGFGRLMTRVVSPASLALSRYPHRLLKDTDQSFFLDYYIGFW